MKAVIFCDDFAFAARARSILLRVGRRSDVDVRWTVKSWPIVALDDAALSERMRSEVKDAHLIVISGDHARSLPLHLRNWLEQWATHRRIEDAAVGVIDESDHPAPEAEAFSDLKLLLQKHGLNLITRHAADHPSKIFPTFSEERSSKYLSAAHTLLIDNSASDIRDRNELATDSLCADIALSDTNKVKPAKT